jgi:Tol biopolymer transport system component
MREARIQGIGIEAATVERVTPAISAAGISLLRVAVITGMIYLLLELLFLAGVRPVHAQSGTVAAGVRLEAGIEKEDVDGDLKSATDIYQKISADTAAPRDVRAKALLRLAGCDEKLGKQAKQVYEEIVRDYADQAAAAEARKRLASIKQQEHPAPPATMTLRKIEWKGLGWIDVSDTDGDRTIYVPWNGSLYFGDLAGHTKRLVFKAEPDSSALLGWQASRDFSKLLLVLKPNPERPAMVALVNIDGSGYRELVHDDAQGNILGIATQSQWSWDNRSLLFYTPSEAGKGFCRLWVVSASDGQHRELVSTEETIWKAVFSPDGRYVAYEVWPKDRSSTGMSRIFVVPAQGGEPRMIYESGPWGVARFSLLKDWTADGRFLAIKDVRGGKSALYLLPMINGSATGPATFVRYGAFDDAYTTASGALVYTEQSTKPTKLAAFIASFDPDGHLGSWRHLELRGRLDGSSPFQSFSPDGRQIVYLAADPDPARRDIVLRDLSTGKERVLYDSAIRNLYCFFSANVSKVFCTETVEDRGKWTSELISLTVDSGLVERVASFQGTRIILQSPLDDNIFFFSTNENATGNPPVVRWDRSTRQETVVSTPSANPTEEDPSHDGRWLVRMMNGSSQVRPMTGGQWRTLVSGLTEYLPPETTPDGKWILYNAIDSSGKRSLFRVSINGGDPQRLGGYPIREFTGRDTLRISPDGREILAAETEFTTNYDLWVLENFEPPASK